MNVLGQLHPILKGQFIHNDNSEKAFVHPSCQCAKIQYSLIKYNRIKMQINKHGKSFAHLLPNAQEMRANGGKPWID